MKNPNIKKIPYIIVATFVVLSPGWPAYGLDPLQVQPAKPAVISSCENVSEDMDLNLSKALRISLCNNPRTKLAWERVMAASASYGQSNSAYMPYVEVGYGTQRNYTNSAGSVFNSRGNQYNSSGADITLDWLLYDFGGREADISFFKQQMNQLGWQFNSELQNLTYDLVKAYVDVLNASGALDAALRSEDASKEAYMAAKARLDVGLVTQVDTAQSETAYAQNVLNREIAENQMQLAKANLAILMNLAPDSDYTIEEVNPSAFSQNVDDDIKTLINKALKTRPDLEAVRAVKLQSEAELDKANSAYLPTISATGAAGENNFSRGADRSSTEGSVGVRISVPLFTGFDNTYNRNRAKAELKASEQQIKQLENDISLDVWRSYNNFTTAQRNYETVKVLLKSAELSEELALGRYKAGKGTLIEALDSQSNLAEARKTYVQAKYDVVLTKFDLYRAIGSRDINLN